MDCIFCEFAYKAPRHGNHPVSGDAAMRRTGAMIVAAILACVASGCGTAANLAGQDHWFMCPPSRPPVPFGGVINDGTVLWHAGQHGIGDGAVIFSMIALIDMPLSLGADVVTLPWATYELVRETRQPSGKYASWLPNVNNAINPAFLSNVPIEQPERNTNPAIECDGRARLDFSEKETPR
jgi:uncharacterized protein YceK